MSTVEIPRPATTRRDLLRRLYSAANCLALFHNPEAVALQKECWDQLALIGSGCPWCGIGPNGVLVAAETFLNGGAVVSDRMSSWEAEAWVARSEEAEAVARAVPEGGESGE